MIMIIIWFDKIKKLKWILQQALLLSGWFSILSDSGRMVVLQRR